MKEYGYINESGYLRTKEIRVQTEKYYDGKEVKTRTISIEEQEKLLKEKGWKEVETIDNNQLNAPDGFSIRIIPYDAGDKISFRYEKVVDRKGIRSEIAALKDKLSESDYKVIKCYEASLIGKELPYDIASLYSERQSIRDRINDLELKIQI